jgi:23S rRNA pseudouridine1911/1915/1917 synthase
LPAERLTLEFCVEPQFEGLRLDSYLAAKIPRLSRSRIQEILRESLRSPEGRALKAATLVHAGLCFTLDRPVPPEPPLPAVPIVYEDDALLVLEKPAGLAVHPTARYHRCTLTAFLRTRPTKADPAHRLDRETSGLLVCGKGSVATAALKAAFAAQQVDKRYLALVEGWPASESFEIDLPLQLGTGHVRVRMEVGKGKSARTEAIVKQRLLSPASEKLALLELHPRSGRQHQIRAHLAAVGHPIVGDKIYGFDERCFVRFTEGALTPEDHLRLRLPRHALHACFLSLRHPVSAEPSRWESPLPADLAEFLTSLNPA